MQGTPGIKILGEILPDLIKSTQIDFVIVNGENSDKGRGITKDQVKKYQHLGVDVITGGNHSFDNPKILSSYNEFPFLLRPLNFPPGVNGQGSVTLKDRSGNQIAVINLQGRAFLPPIDCPFRTAEAEITKLRLKTPIIVVDFHAESTAEKQAFAWNFDGEVSAVIGTHTHVQTADERILPSHTGYITDVGMTGSFDSVIGLVPSIAIRKFVTQTHQWHQIADDNLRLNGVLLDIDVTTGNCLNITRVNLP